MRIVQALVALVTAWVSLSAALAAESVPVRVVVVAMFEEGGDSGDGPGELRAWVERYPLPEVLPFPVGERNLRYNRERQVLGIVTGVGTARAAASITALGLDPRFDLSKAYWLVAGIAGATPTPRRSARPPGRNGSSTATSPSRSTAARSRRTGRPATCRCSARPVPGATPARRLRSVYRLNPKTVDWAFRLTRDVALPDNPALAAWRAKYAGHPAAGLSPRVMKGDVLSARPSGTATLLNDWASRWVPYWTGGGVFATSAMEDTRTLAALTRLAKAGRVDLDRCSCCARRATSPCSTTASAPKASPPRARRTPPSASRSMRPSRSGASWSTIVDHWDVHGARAPGAVAASARCVRRFLPVRTAGASSSAGVGGRRRRR
jgi:purine nucleoside permease